MAVVYNLNNYRSTRKKINGDPPPETRVTKDTDIDVRQLSISGVSLICEETRKKIKETKVFMEQCQKACELKNVEQMIEERDRILDRLNSNTKS